MHASKQPVELASFPIHLSNHAYAIHSYHFCDCKFLDLDFPGSVDINFKYSMILNIVSGKIQTRKAADMESHNPRNVLNFDSYAVEFSQNLVVGMHLF